MNYGKLEEKEPKKPVYVLPAQFQKQYVKGHWRFVKVCIPSIKRFLLYCELKYGME